ncbi:MAG TPA: glycosyltransferase, partial [Steroidobacteraceae bacterium]
MACGTPVIAWNCGSVPEIVREGVTGRVVGSEDEAIEAVEQVAALDRGRIRQEFDSQFSSTVMANNYLKVYRRLADKAIRPSDLKYAG